MPARGYLISKMVKLHLGCSFFSAAITSDSVGGFRVTLTALVPVTFGTPPVDEYLSFTVTDGTASPPGIKNGSAYAGSMARVGRDVATAA